MASVGTLRIRAFKARNRARLTWDESVGRVPVPTDGKRARAIARAERAESIWLARWESV